MNASYHPSKKILFCFLFGWTILNALQASFTDIHADEAYYWMYSRFLDWGYFDHPPMVALFIKVGDYITHSALGLRLCTIASSTLSAYLLWKIVEPYAQNIKLFVLLFASMVLFHVYSFITTPDTPLFFFSILFLYVYQRYLTADKLKWVVALAAICALMLYSKYHGVLLIFFTILSNLSLFKRKSFYACILLTSVFLLPHLWWQYTNGFPSLYFHLIDRSIESYTISYTIEYILPQLALAGPLVGWLLFPLSLKVKSTDLFQRALKFNLIGIFIFFLISTAKGRVEAHWTLLSFIPFMLLSYIALSRMTVIPKWFNPLALIGIALILMLRVTLMIPISYLSNAPFFADYYGSKQWADQLSAKATDKPVFFLDAFQEPSKYNFYTNTTNAFGYNSRNYRKTQYDVWPLEDSLINKRICLILDNPMGLDKSTHTDTIATVKGTKYGYWIDSVRTYQKVNIEALNIPTSWSANEVRSVKISIYNPYDHTISFSNDNQKWACTLEYGYNTNGNFGAFSPFSTTFNQLTIAPGNKAELSGIIKAPSEPGKYKLIFSIRTKPFAGPRNSHYIPIEVK